jgi:signal transduction histidine kinase
VKFTHNDVPRDLNREIALCIFRIVQEALRNIGRHSGATEAHVHVVQQDSEIRLRIADNGRGFEMPRLARHAGLGLVGMRERVRLVRGTINVDSAPDQGTRIEVDVPLAVTEK